MLFCNLDAAQLVGIAGALLVVGITFHEFSHAFVADQLGDHRPRALGRVSLNPTRPHRADGRHLLPARRLRLGAPGAGEHLRAAPGRIGMSVRGRRRARSRTWWWRSWLRGHLPGARRRRLLGAGDGFVWLCSSTIVFYNVVLALFNLLPDPAPRRLQLRAAVPAAAHRRSASSATPSTGCSPCCCSSSSRTAAASSPLRLALRWRRFRSPGLLIGV